MATNNNGTWVVEEKFINADLKEEAIAHLFRTKRDAESFKAKSEKAWDIINKQSLVDGRVFIIKFSPCKVEYEQDECSRPSDEMVAEYQSIC